MSHIAVDLFGGTERSAAIDALHAATAIYTAEHVVNSLLDRVSWPVGNGSLLDASAGNGSFVRSSLTRLLAIEPGISPSRVLQLLQGWEIHPDAAEEAVRCLAALFREHGWENSVANQTARSMIVNRDFLTQTPTRFFSVIVGNPPYLRFCNIPSILRAEYEAIMPTYACADLLHSFLNQCLQVLEPDGEIAMVTADRWLFNMGAAKLREMMGSRLSINHLERLDASTAFYRPKIRMAGTPPRIHPVALVMRGGSDGIALNKEAIYPDALGPGGAEEGVKLSDIASVRICPWLGKEGVFVIPMEAAKGLPPECLIPCVDTDDIRGGILQTPKRFAIRTFPGVEPPPEVVRHLRSSLHRLPATGQRAKDWWMPPESFHALALDRESLLIPRITRELRFVRLPAGILGINHNLTVVAANGVSLDEVEKLLASDKAKQWVAGRAARLENGFLSITTSLLRRLPCSLGAS